MKHRIERDSMGEVSVPEEHRWGAQTQRSLENFPIGWEMMPERIVWALGLIKKAAAVANGALGVLPEEKASAIAFAADEIISGKIPDEFPLKVWQTGSGTQTNMNVNEVLAHMTGLHPNDDINKGQSSNDTFPAAMHIATLTAFEEELLPALSGLRGTFDKLSKRYMEIIKMGRTHLQDATPLRLGSEIGAWREMLDRTTDMIGDSLKHLRILALGGSAVGTGLNTHPDFGMRTAELISEYSGHSFVTAPDKFHALSSKDGMAVFHGALKVLAADLMKIANDIRFLASGPRGGIGELTIPENEPGSSIMPGKVNPTQCEALTMVCVQVMGNDVTVGIAASQGNLQLNVFMPVMAYNVLQSLRLLTDAVSSFDERCAKGIRPNEAVIKERLEDSLMLVTALTPHIGYEKAVEIAKRAHAQGQTLKEAAMSLGILTSEECDSMMDPSKMV